MFYRRLLAIGFLSFFLVSPVYAVDIATTEVASGVSKPVDVVQTATGKQIIKGEKDPSQQEWGKTFSDVTLAPHRALYTMTLASAKNGSNITGVTGRMLFEWTDDCEGWAVQQHLQLHFTYAEGDESDVNSTLISWESKDGKRYNFNVRRLTNDKETERYRGRATIDHEGGSGKYTIPKDKQDVVLPAASLFPSGHTLLILEKAIEGEKFFTKRVYDGSDEEGVADVSAFIGEPGEQLKPDELTEELRKNPLLVAKAWPVRLAFFKPETETGEPDYEMDLVLQANGVARSMLIDYGDFAVSGVLSNVEPMPAEGCKE